MNHALAVRTLGNIAAAYRLEAETGPADQYRAQYTQWAEQLEASAEALAALENTQEG